MASPGAAKAARIEESVSEPKAIEAMLFDARLQPHRSLGPNGFRALMLGCCLVSTLYSLPFYLMGAWPVVGFLGLDVLLVYWAFRANYRTAAAFEEVTVTASELRVRRVSHRGQVAEWTLNPLWTQLDRESHEEFGLLRLFLVSRGRRLAVAGFLSPKEKESFATALTKALSEAKRGPTRAVVS